MALQIEQAAERFLVGQLREVFVEVALQVTECEIELGLCDALARGRLEHGRESSRCHASQRWGPFPR
jgi:hypothetical protein